MSNFTESTIEQAAIDWLKELGYNYAFSPEIVFDGGVRVARLRNGVPMVMNGQVWVGCDEGGRRKDE